MLERAPTRPLPARTEFITGEAALRGLRCAEALYPAGLRLDRHVHERPSVTVIAAGSLVELCGPRLRPVPCAAGAVVVRPGGEPHANAVGSAGVVNVELEIDRALLDRYGLPIAHPEVHPTAALGSLVPRLRRALAGREAAALLLAEALALEILALILPERPASPRRARWLERVHERILDEFRSVLTVTELARDADVHPVYLARAFRERYGASPAETIRALRIEWAAAQLTEGRRPIADIALEAGFHDQSHFTRRFRAAVGVPPGAYRRERRSKE
jgi:AraC family transcriptional regulator